MGLIDRERETGWGHRASEIEGEREGEERETEREKREREERGERGERRERKESESESESEKTMGTKCVCVGGGV